MSRGPERSVPPWAAPFFTGGQYARFIDLVREHFAARGEDASVGDGVVVREGASGSGHFGLGNLAQVCRKSPADDWPEVIAAHFDRCERLDEEEAALEERVDDFDAVAPDVAVRVYPHSVLEGIEASWVYREDLEGTITALVFDLPNHIRGVRPEEVERWGKDREELFATGIANVLDAYGEQWSTEQVGLEEGVELTVVTGEDFFAPTQALVLGDDARLRGTHGTLVGIPHRHALLAYPIEDLRVVVALNRLIPVVAGMHREGPGSISPHLYWHRPDGFLRLPARIEDDSLVFEPPDEFVDLLNELAEEAGTDDGGA